MQTILSQYINWFSQNQWYNHDGNRFGEGLIIEVFFVTLVTIDHWSLCCSVLCITFTSGVYSTGWQDKRITKPLIWVCIIFCAQHGDDGTSKTNDGDLWRRFPVSNRTTIKEAFSRRLQRTSQQYRLSRPGSNVFKHRNIKTWKYSSPKTLQVVVQKHHRSYIQLPEAFNFVSYSCHFGFINYFHDFLFQTKHRKHTGWPGLVRSQEWILARTLYWYQLRTQALPLVLSSLGWGKMHSFHIYVAQENYVRHIFENPNWWETRTGAWEKTPKCLGPTAKAIVCLKRPQNGRHTESTPT